MAEKVRKTKTELKDQKEALQRYQRFLPTLKLKKAQLISELKTIDNKIEKLEEEIEKALQDIERWVAVYGEDIDLDELFEVEEIITSEDNIAGIDIEVFEDIKVNVADYDLFETPYWIDRGIEEVLEQIKRKAQITVLKRQKKALEEELRITVQRINLFEKVKIPETKENIRMIQIFLGDRQRAQVVRGKISKNKIEEQKQQAEA